MTDNQGFVREVNSDMRSENAMAILRKYWWVLALVFFVAIGLVAFNEYRSYQKNTEAAANYDLISKANAGDALSEDEQTTLNDADSEVALMEKARLLRVENDEEGAIAIYQQIANRDDFSDTGRAFARLQIYGLQGGEPSDLANPGAPFRVEAKMVEADTLLVQGDVEGALVVLEGLMQNVELQSERAFLETLVISLGGEVPEFASELEGEAAGAEQNAEDAGSDEITGESTQSETQSQ